MQELEKVSPVENGLQIRFKRYVSSYINMSRSLGIIAVIKFEKKVAKMDNVIDFISIKNKKINDEILKIFSRSNSLDEAERIDKLVKESTLSVTDHHKFLAFVSFLEEKKLNPEGIFLSVLELSIHQFKMKYDLKWSSIAHMCFIFMKILNDSDPDKYDKFIKLKKRK